MIVLKNVNDDSSTVISNSKNYLDAVKAAREASTPKDFDSFLNKYVEDGYACVMLTHNPYTPVNVLRVLAEHDNYEVRAAVAGRTDYPFEYLNNNSNLPEITSVPADVLEKLAEDEHPKVRSALILNHLTPEHVLSQLAEDEDVRVISAFFDLLHFLPTYDSKRHMFTETVVTNLLKLCPEKTLEIAEFPYTPSHILEEIFETTKNARIEHATLINPNISENMALKYLNSCRLGNFSKINPDIILNILGTADNLTQLNMFVDILKYNFNEYVASSHLKHTSEDFKILISSGMFKNIYTPPETIQHLYETLDFNKKNSSDTLLDYVNIASNPSTPQHILEYFCINTASPYENPDIVEALASNPSTPQSAILEPLFLKKIRTEEANYYAAVRIVRRGELSAEQIKNIIYGDYSEFFIQYIAEYCYLGEEERSYIALKYGNAHVRNK